MLPIFLLVGFLLLTLAVSLAGRPWTQEFFQGGRRARTGAVAASLLATCIGASGTVGIVGRAYRVGWSAFLWFGSGSLGLILLGWVFARRMRAPEGVRTLPAWLGQAYGRPARRLAAVLIAILWTGIVAAQWIPAGRIVGNLTGMPYAASVLTIGMLVAAYTALGGQNSVLRTDALQLAFIMAAVLLPHVFLSLNSPVPLSFPTPVSLLVTDGGVSVYEALALVVVVGGMYVVGPDLCSRVLVAHSDRDARRGAVTAGLCLLPLSLLVVMLGVRIHLLESALPSDTAPYTWLLHDSGILPAYAALLVDLGLLAALFSSADTCLLTAATVVQLDLLGDDTPAAQRNGRWLVLLFAAAGVLIATEFRDIIRVLVLAYAFYAGGLLMPLLLLATEQWRRIPRHWVWAGILVGGTCPLAVLRLSSGVRDSSVAGGAGVLMSLLVLGAGWAVGRYSVSR